MKPENYPKFSEKFEEFVTAKINENLRTPEIEIDSMLDLKDINGKFYRVLKQFAPFGPGNMSPVFQTNNLIDTGYARIVGNNHLKLSVVQLEVSSYPISSIAFQQGDEEHLEYVKTGRPFNICYHIEENEWNGLKSLQLNIKDIKPSQT
jgi:single-stranded-DNA-specific exonuclease